LLICGSELAGLQGVKTKIRAMGKMALLKKNSMHMLAADAEAASNTKPEAVGGTE
jgi:hypothetical protein